MQYRKLTMAIALTIGAYSYESLALDCSSLDDPYARFYCSAKGEVHERASLWFNSLTPEQQQIERILSQEQENYRSVYGNFIPATRENVIVFANKIGAGNSHWPFIAERMHYYATEVESIYRMTE